MDVYIHSPIRLHGMALNKLSTGTSLPFTLSTENWRVVFFFNKAPLHTATKLATLNFETQMLCYLHL
jgi:hypothetical protein